LSDEAENLVKRSRTFTDLPIAVGFGISTAAQIKAVCRYADAAVVGSAIVKEIERVGGILEFSKRSRFLKTTTEEFRLGIAIDFV
jgi:tryptophan synthase alpha chain